jgi:quinol monooxygenase YgiN
MGDGVRVVVVVSARPDAAETMKSIVLTLADRSRKETGCIRYEVLQDKATPQRFVLVEEWSSTAALDAHNQTAHFHEAVTSAVPLLAEPLEVGRYTAIG